MRMNLRKVFFVGGLVTLLWFIVTYSSLLEMPASPVKKNVMEIENRVEILQQQMDKQISDSSMLLEKVKKQLKKNESPEKVDEDAGTINKLDASSLVLPVLLIACDRVTVRRCLDNLIKFRPNKDMFPIIVSQDCAHNATYKVIKSFVDADPTISVITQPDRTEIPLPKAKVKFRGYYKIARHYKFALNYVLEELGHEAVIIVEDDLDISSDFFEYFLGTYQLLLQDPSLWCISAWNDNGKKEVIDMSHPELLHRTDFFPGLGWMMRADTWRDLEPNWPPAFFDDWLRNPENVKNRSCIRPEISRTYSFGKIGVSKGLFFEKHLRNIQLNMEYVEFLKMDLSYLLKSNYDAAIASTVYALPLAESVSAAMSGREDARVSYSDAASFRQNAKKLGLMDDFRSGVPRTAYRGIVSCYVTGRVYLAPSYKWTKYDPSWG